MSLDVHSLPIISKMDSISGFKLLEGYSAETSGGLLMMVDKAKINDLQSELLEVHNEHSWIVGKITNTNGENQARVGKPEVIDVKVL